jgi:hypothetical protein
MDTRLDGGSAWSEINIEHTRIGAAPISRGLGITISRFGFAPHKSGVALARLAWNTSKGNDYLVHGFIGPSLDS